MVSRKVEKIIGVFVLGLIIAFLMLLFTQTIGLSRAGFDAREVLDEFYFYAYAGMGFLVMVLLGFGIEYFITKGDERYGDNVFFDSQGEKPSLKFFKRFTRLQLFLLCFIIFSTLSLVGSYTKQKTFTGVEVIEQQFTVVDSLLFSTALIPLAENLGAAALIVVLIVIVLKPYARKKNWSSDTYRSLAYVLVPLAVVIYAVLNHLLRYRASETSLMIVALFWGLGGLITVISGSFIPFWAAHITNNLVFDLNRYMSSEIVLVYITISIFLLGTLYYFLYRKKGLFGRKGRL